MSRAAVVLASLALGACHPPRTTPHPTTGELAGLARDHDSGDAIAQAEVRLRAQGQLGAPTITHTDRAGTYLFSHLAPGRYDLVAEFAGQPIEVSAVDVRAGEIAFVDLPFTLGRPDKIAIVFGDPKLAEIDRYRPHGLAATAAIVEGTVSDLGTKARIVGAVVNVVGPGDGDGANTQQGVTDAQGRFRFDAAPGTYVVSAYYAVDGHGQIEVRRSGIVVAGGEAVVVPLWIESAR